MKTFTLIAALLFGAYGQAQYYTFSHFNESYIEFSDGEAWPEEDWDDPEIIIQLPFELNIGGATSNTLMQIGYGSDWAIIDIQTLVYSSFTYWPDLIAAQNSTTANPSSIRWKVTGDPGSRILKIQYKDAAFWAEYAEFSTANDRVNVQMWFHENGAMEYRFGPSNVQAPTLAYEGFPGPPIYYLLNYSLMTDEFTEAGMLSGPSANPTMSMASTTDPDLLSLDNTPANGRVYRFAPVSLTASSTAPQQMEVYPTLATEAIYIRGVEAAGQRYEISTITGARISAGNASTGRIDVSQLAAGAYLIHLEGAANVVKFMKQ